MPDVDRIAFVDPLIKAIWDAVPVAEGHLLLAPHRHVASWADLHGSEQAALTQAIQKARAHLIERFGPDGFNVGFDEGAAGGQSVPHFHIHVIPRHSKNDVSPAGGLRYVIPAKGDEPAVIKPAAVGFPIDTPHSRALIAGGEDALLPHLLPQIDQASQVDVAVSFLMESGIRLLRPHLQDLLDRQGRLRLVTGDYLDVTDPDALRRLMDLDGDTSLFVFEAGLTAFHPKSWIFHFDSGAGVAVVGSSNLSATALKTGVEWNYRTFHSTQEGGWADVLDGFEQLIARPDVKSLTHEWIDAYELRRVRQTRPPFQAAAITVEPTPPKPDPHIIQRRALAALEETRRDGYGAGLVVLATGLGKTWLSAFDSDRLEFHRVLFVAHREEILNQAIETFRRCRPKSRLGRYSGQEKDLNADVVFASIQTLGRVEHLRQFPPDAFDYVVIDEFHHAAARTYRNLIAHFTPKFLLGLTATPDRMDGADLLGLCEENLVFRCNAFEGIEGGLLSPFSYFGVPDEVDYSNIPWRSSGFDETELTAALATGARAANALEQLKKHGGSRTLAFCCSQRHAGFMADYFTKVGLRAVAVHSGTGSAPRSSSLEKLQSGDVDVVFAVDMFNEGVDVPNIDTVLMLRPTESATIWMQQFGRGLRMAEGKLRLNVIDYIGNHRIFLTKARTLLNCSDGDRALALKLQQVADGLISLPHGCDVTYELRALDLMKSLLRPTNQGDALEAWYIDFRLRLGHRPTALEVFHAGFAPRTTGHGSWFEFVRDQGDLKTDEQVVLTSHRGFLDDVAKTTMTKSYKMLVLQAMLQADAFPGEIPMERLVARFSRAAKRNPAFRRDVSVDIDDLPAVWRLLEAHPIKAWTEAKGAYFTSTHETFQTAFTVSPVAAPTLRVMTEEIVEWRLAEYVSRDAYASAPEEPEAEGFADSAVQTFDYGQAEVWREYLRPDIAPLFGHRFSTALWNQGFVVQGRDVFLLATLEKKDLMAEHRYNDGFMDPQHFRWQSQNKTTQASAHGRIINQSLPGYAIHLFVRATKKRGSKPTPFFYCGQVDFQDWEGDLPITVTWKLRNPAPQHLLKVLRVV